MLWVEFQFRQATRFAETNFFVITMTLVGNSGSDHYSALRVQTEI